MQGRFLVLMSFIHSVPYIYIATVRLDIKIGLPSCGSPFLVHMSNQEKKLWFLDVKNSINTYRSFQKFLTRGRVQLTGS